MNSDLEAVHYFNSVTERWRTWTRLCYPGWTTVEIAVLLYWASPTIKTRWSCRCSNHSISKYKITGFLETPHTLLRVLLICSVSLSLAMVLQKWAKWMLLPALPIKISQCFSITMSHLKLLKTSTTESEVLFVEHMHLKNKSTTKSKPTNQKNKQKKHPLDKRWIPTFPLVFC